MFLPRAVSGAKSSHPARGRSMQSIRVSARPPCRSTIANPGPVKALLAASQGSCSTLPNVGNKRPQHQPTLEVDKHGAPRSPNATARDGTSAKSYSTNLRTREARLTRHAGVHFETRRQCPCDEVLQQLFDNPRPMRGYPCQSQGRDCENWTRIYSASFTWWRWWIGSCWFRWTP